MPEVADTTAVIAEETQKKLVATGQLFHTLAADPRYRKRVLGLIKEAAPDSVIPELETDREIDTRVTAGIKPLEEQNKSLQARLDKIEQDRARQLWADREGLSDEEVVEVEALAKEGKIGDGKTAIEFWRAKQALGTPRGTTRRAGSDEYLTSLSKVDPRAPNAGARLKALATTEAQKILTDMRRGRRSA